MSPAAKKSVIDPHLCFLHKHRKKGYLLINDLKKLFQNGRNTNTPTCAVDLVTWVQCRMISADIFFVFLRLLFFALLLLYVT